MGSSFKLKLLRLKRASLEAIEQTPWSGEHLSSKEARRNYETNMLLL